MTLYPTFSLAVLWNIDARGLNESMSEQLIEPCPVDGDAHLRARAELLERTTAMNSAWSKVREEVVASARDTTRHSALAAARDEYRAQMSSHVATVLHGGDLSTLEVTC